MAEIRFDVRTDLWYVAAAIDAGKGFFASLLASYVTGGVDIARALIVAGIMAGLAFFTKAGVSQASTSQPGPQPPEPQTTPAGDP